MMIGLVAPFVLLTSIRLEFFFHGPCAFPPIPGSVSVPRQLLALATMDIAYS
jgi:hypothetical protein